MSASPRRAGTTCPAVLEHASNCSSTSPGGRATPGRCRSATRPSSRADMHPAPWFAREEYLARVARVQAALKARGLDALLAFQPESVTWLTGFFTRGYSTFQ